MDKELLLADDVARLLKVDRQRIYELCRTDPSFPVIKLGQRQYRFAFEAICQWLKNGGSRKESDSGYQPKRD